MSKKSNFDFEVKTFRVGLFFFLLPILAKVETLIKVLGTIFYSSYIPLLSGSRKFFESLIFSTVAEKVESNFCVGKSRTSRRLFNHFLASHNTSKALSFS